VKVVNGHHRQIETAVEEVWQGARPRCVWLSRNWHRPWNQPNRFSIIAIDNQADRFHFAIEKK